MRKPASSIWKDCGGSAAAEMALCIPLLLIILFGSFELGKYFLDEHVVVKSVRDGARYAARQSFSDYGGCAPSTTVIDNTRNLTRTGQVTAGGTARLAYWTDQETISVTVACTSGTYEGIYLGATDGAPVVKVRATVPYTPLFASIVFPSASLNLHAESEATVAGL